MEIYKVLHHKRAKAFMGEFFYSQLPNTLVHICKYTLFADSNNERNRTSHTCTHTPVAMAQDFKLTDNKMTP